MVPTVLSRRELFDLVWNKPVTKVALISGSRMLQCTRFVLSTGSRWSAGLSGQGRSGQSAGPSTGTIEHRGYVGFRATIVRGVVLSLRARASGSSGNRCETDISLEPPLMTPNGHCAARGVLGVAAYLPRTRSAQFLLGRERRFPAGGWRHDMPVLRSPSAFSGSQELCDSVGRQTPSIDSPLRRGDVVQVPTRPKIAKLKHGLGSLEIAIFDCGYCELHPRF
jgi:hypothetical protein